VCARNRGATVEDEERHAGDTGFLRLAVFRLDFCATSIRGERGLRLFAPTEEAVDGRTGAADVGTERAGCS